MSVVFDHRDAGTAEADWQAAAPWRGTPALTLDVDRVVVVAAHPDDETLGAGGLVSTAAAAGIRVVVVIATDGEAADPTSPGLARRRRREAVEAVDALDPTADVRFLGLPDGGLREHRGALAAAVAAELAATAGTTLLVAPWPGDGHGDHRVAGEVACDAAGPTVRVATYPIWLWHWGEPDAVDAAGWQTLALDPAARAAKARALARYASQLHGDPPMLSERMRAHFARDVEVFAAAPARAGAAALGAPAADAADAPDTAGAAAGTPPADAPGDALPREYFDGFYARHDDPWGLESRWYERRKRALLMATLPRERFASVLEIGCATGLVTRELAARADRVLAVDIAAAAIDRAAARLGGARHVSFSQRDATRDWPAGAFDLVVLSEVGYFWSAAALRRVLDAVHGSLAPDGVLVACHWRHAFQAAPQTGDDVHAMLAASDLRSLSQHVEDDFRLDVLAHAGTPGVARATGVLP